MTIIFRSIQNKKELIRITNAQVMQAKTEEEVIDFYTSMKYEEYDEEGNILGYVCANYMFEEDFIISII